MPVLIRQAWCIAHKTSELWKLDKIGNRWKPIRCHEIGHAFELDEKDRIGDEENAIGPLLQNRIEDNIEVSDSSHFKWTNLK